MQLPVSFVLLARGTVTVTVRYVGLAVLPQRRHIFKRLRTQMALCRVSGFLVDPQQSGVLKTLGAQVAAERFVSRHVSFEVRFVPEILSAVFTLGISHGMSLHHVREELVFFQYNV